MDEQSKKKFPVPPPASKNIWFFNNETNEWCEGTIIDCVFIKRSSKNSTWNFFIAGSDGKTRSIKTTSTSVSKKEFDFELVKNRSVVEAPDLNSMVFPNEPEIIDFLSKSFLKNKQCYHRVGGDITIAVNPSEKIINEEDCDNFISNHNSFYNIDHKVRERVPHVFEVAEQAFSSMTADKYRLDKRVDQTIFVCGSSGSGKTESIKFLLEYFSKLSMRILRECITNSCMLESPRLLALRNSGPDSSSSLNYDNSLEGHFSSVNTVLESMGSACTPSNSNSSRFSRVVELGYAADCYIEDINVEYFLLEAKRVHSHPRHERNFHIFYELAHGASPEFKEKLGIGDLHDFHFTSQSDVYSRFDKLSDSANFVRFARALTSLQVSASCQKEFLKCIASILHIGNLTFEEERGGGSEGGCVALSESAANTRHAKYVCRLLSIDIETFNKTFGKKHRDKDGMFLTHLSIEDAIQTRNYIASTIYQLLFQWLLDQFKKIKSLPDSSSQSCISKICVADLSGSESIEKNSFIQLCTNYTSEKIREHFTATIFVKEQSCYFEEGMKWTSLSLMEEEDTLQIFEAPVAGMFDILEAELQLQRPSDARFMEQCAQKVKSGCFSLSSSKDQKALKFTIFHYFEDVTYDASGFIQESKTRLISQELKLIFKNSTSSFVKGLWSNADKVDQRVRFLSASNRPKSSTALLRKQLTSLLDRSKATKTHWLMCVRPCAAAVPGKFDKPFALKQIRDRGFVSAIVLKNKGFSHHMSFKDFVSEFYDLVMLGGKCAVSAPFLYARHQKQWKEATCHLLAFTHITEEILTLMDVQSDEYSLGKLKSPSSGGSYVVARNSVFLKQGMYTYLEQLSFRVRIFMIVKLQRHIRYRMYYRHMKTSAQTVRTAVSVRSLHKSFSRSVSSVTDTVAVVNSSLAYFANVKFSKVLRETNARIIIQRFARAALIYLHKVTRRRLALKLQSIVRGFLIRSVLRKRMLYAVNLVKLKWKYLVRHKYFVRKYKAATLLCRAWRRYQRRKEAWAVMRVVVNVQRTWRRRRVVKKMETAAFDSAEKRDAFNRDFIRKLDSKLLEDPFYLINLLKREEEAVRLSRRVDELKKISILRMQELKEVSDSLHKSKIEIKSLESQVASTSKKKSSSGSADKRHLLRLVAELQTWIREKEIIRISSLEELFTTEGKMTSIMFDCALQKQRVADIENTINDKVRALKDMEFDKTLQNAERVDYEIKHLKHELASLVAERERLQTTSVKELKSHESLKQFCETLNSRIEANSTAIQLAEMQFGLQALQDGVTELFSKNKERLKAGDNESNRNKASEKNKISEEVKKQAVTTLDNQSEATSNGASKRIADSPFKKELSFRQFVIDEPLPHYTDAQMPKLSDSPKLMQSDSLNVSEMKKVRRNTYVKNLSPPDNANGHKWRAKFLPKPTWCHICKKFIQGLTMNQQHAFKCVNCKAIGHRDCCEEFNCKCGSLVVNEDDTLAPADKNEHLWVSKLSSIEEKCELCAKYISDTEPGKSPFQCRRCKIFGHRDCCAKFCVGRQMCSKNAKSSSNVTDAVTNRINNVKESVIDIFSSVSLDLNGHKFKNKHLTKPTWCVYCKQFIIGLTMSQQDAIKCNSCKDHAHRKCGFDYNTGQNASKHLCPKS